MAARLVVHPAFYRRVRHYRDRIGVQDARPQTALRFVQAVHDLVPQLSENPERGYSARFEASDLAETLKGDLSIRPIHHQLIELKQHGG